MQLFAASALLCLLGVPQLGIAGLISRQALPANSSVLRVIQATPPVRFVDTDGSIASPACSDVLVEYSFQNSYGQPFVGPYTPPACDFNRVSWNLTVTSRGRQFDRLATVALGDIEVFRTSTAEPTASGIIWTYIKDLSPFATLFKEPQTLIFDLGNIINDIYTGPFNVTLTASYYQVDDNNENRAADQILSISKGSFNSSSVFNTPPDNATSLVTLPKNAEKAIVSIAATGQSLEEFWWSNVLQQDVNDFPSAGTLPGYSPFREVQLFVDGNLAGVVWPFPIIFTGGIVPGFWRPLVGIDAFDLKEDEIDITPWLPLLSDGKPHNFTIVVSGLAAPDADGTVDESETTDTYFVVNGKVFIWLDANGTQTTGSTPVTDYPAPSIDATSTLTPVPGTNDTFLNYNVDVSRSLSISSTLQTSSGSREVSWSQSLSYTGNGQYSDGGNLEVNTLTIQGNDTSSSGYSRQITYPLTVASLYTPLPDGFALQGNLTRGKDVTLSGPSIYPNGLESFSTDAPGSVFATTQVGTAVYVSNTTSNVASSTGDTNQTLTLSAIGGGQLYSQTVEARNGTIVQDDIVDAEVAAPPVVLQGAKPERMQFAVRKQGLGNRFGQVPVSPP